MLTQVRLPQFQVERWAHFGRQVPNLSFLRIDDTIGPVVGFDSSVFFRSFRRLQVVQFASLFGVKGFYLTFMIIGYLLLPSSVFQSLTWEHSNLGASEVSQLLEGFEEKMEELRALQGVEVEFEWADDRKGFTFKYRSV